MKGSVPRATYRLQLRPGFDFDAAAGVAPYLRDLGVSHLYSSPYLQAAPGSTHGYDVVDHGRVNQELGGDPGHRRLLAALAAAGLGQILDIVPNHMAIAGPRNAWWWDVLENGPSSRFATHFDVSWDPPEAKLRNRILMPVLGDHYGRVLEAGELRLQRAGLEFRISYHEHLFPVAPTSLGKVLRPAAEAAGSRELEELAAALEDLPTLEPGEREAARERHRRRDELIGRLGRLCAERPPLAEAVDRVVAALNGDPERMDALLERQSYRLARWQTAGFELDYRRFFDVNTLAAIRTEDEEVFAATHRLVLDWLRSGVLDGVRVDHPDGLRDPRRYFERIHEAAPAAWVVAEKILEPGERLPETWPVAGTTGYDFANRACAVLVDPAGEAPLTDLYRAFTGEPAEYGEVAYEKKQLVMVDLLASDVNRLAALFVRVCESRRRFRDYTRRELLLAIREVIACLPVYRTYVRPGDVSGQDRRNLEAAVAAAGRRRPDLDPELLDLLRSLLLLEFPEGEPSEPELELVARFQQTSGPVMAKGVEDTAFYCYGRLVCLNEVGGDPGRFGISVDLFHEAAREAQALWPGGMLATSTHDTKRSEDVRARLALLSEIPERWAEAVGRWAAINERHRSGALPDRGAEYLLYQTLVGAHPLDAGRARAYMEKASKEAKAHTSWIAPAPAYDAALGAFVEACLADSDFTSDLERFTAPLVKAGWVNSLSMKLLALTCPGVPDLYQGSELWDLSLVDPDNRRPVDFELRRRLLAELPALSAEAAWERAAEGLPKLLLVKRALDLRRRLPEAFGPAGGYRPLAVAGERAAHLLAFARGGDVAVLAPRLVLGLGGDWGETLCELPSGRWRDELSGVEVEGGRVPVAHLLARFPVGLLSRIA